MKTIIIINIYIVLPAIAINKIDIKKDLIQEVL